jgi:hypothetical protein
MLRTGVVEKIETDFIVNNFFPDSRAVCEIMWTKYGRTGQATADKMTHALCVLNN